MMNLLKSDTRGQADHGWLKAKHSFSFADYYDPTRTQFGPLRVINEDRIAPAAGFPTHPHRDMEIVTYPISGALEHRDSLGNGAVIRAGEVQRMTAGTGVRHSEYNASQTDEVHLLQIWILPKENGLPPGYEQTFFSREDKLNQLRLIASADGRDSSVTINQDVSLYASILQTGRTLHHNVEDQHQLFLQVVDGALTVNGTRVESGDGLQISDEETLDIHAETATEFLLFDMGHYDMG